MRILMMIIGLIALITCNMTTVLALVVFFAFVKIFLKSNIYCKEGRTMQIREAILLRMGKHGKYEVHFDNGAQMFQNLLISEFLELSLAIVFSLRIGELNKEFLPYFFVFIVLGFFKLWIPAVISTINHYNEAKKGYSVVGIRVNVLEKNDNHRITVLHEKGEKAEISIRAVDWDKIQINTNILVIHTDKMKEVNTFSFYLDSI